MSAQRQAMRPRPGAKKRRKQAPQKWMKLGAKAVLVAIALALLAVVCVFAFGFEMRPCAVCGDWIGFSSYYDEPEFGDVYHLDHKQIPRCDYCGRILSDFSNAGPGIWQLDGRRMCPVCHGTAVVDWAQARALQSSARQRMGGWGLKFPHGEVQMALVDQITLKRLFLTGKTRDGSLEGMTQHTVQHGKAVTEIFVLSGLPLARCRWVIAHELMHAWLFQHHTPVHPLRLEEGAAELAAYRYVREHPDLATSRQIRSALANRDPIYGKGLRLAAEFERAHGFPAFMRLMARPGDFPRGARELVVHPPSK